MDILKKIDDYNLAVEYYNNVIFSRTLDENFFEEFVFYSVFSKKQIVYIITKLISLFENDNFNIESHLKIFLNQMVLLNDFCLDDVSESYKIFSNTWYGISEKFNFFKFPYLKEFFYEIVLYKKDNKMHVLPSDIIDTLIENFFDEYVYLENIRKKI